MQIEPKTDHSRPGGDIGGSGELVEASATVVRVEGRKAVLETKRTNACSGCGVSSGCGTSTLGQVFGKKRNLITIDNDFDAAPGEQVIIGLPESELLAASLAAYMLPLAFMLGLALVMLGLGFGEGVAALAALIGFGLGLWAASRFTLRAGERFTPHFVRRAAPSFPLQGACKR